MFLIAGAGKDAKAVSEGNFFCPQCDEWQQYIHKRISKYVSAFFIPVWRSSSGTEFIERRTCGNQYDAAVLNVDRFAEIDRLVDVARESGKIAVESQDPELAQSNYDVAIEACQLALALKPQPDIHKQLERAMNVLIEQFPGQACANEAIGICDEAANCQSVTEQLRILQKARKVLEEGLARDDISFDMIHSIHEQVMAYIKRAETMIAQQDQ